MCGTHLSSIVKPLYNSLWEAALLALAQWTNLSQTLFPLTLPASGHYQTTFKFMILVFLDTVWVRLHSRHPSVPGLFHLGYHHLHSYCFKWSAQHFKESIKKKTGRWTHQSQIFVVCFCLQLPQSGMWVIDPACCGVPGTIRSTNTLLLQFLFLVGLLESRCENQNPRKATMKTERYNGLSINSKGEETIAECQSWLCGHLWSWLCQPLLETCSTNGEIKWRNCLDNVYPQTLGRE